MQGGAKPCLLGWDEGMLEKWGDPAPWPAPLLYTGDRLLTRRPDSLPRSLALSAQGCLNLRGHRKMTHGKTPCLQRRRESLQTGLLQAKE